MQLIEKTVRRALCAHFHKSAAHFAHLFFFGTVRFFLPAASQQLTRRLLRAPSSNTCENLSPPIPCNKRQDSAEHRPKYFNKVNNGKTARC